MRADDERPLPVLSSYTSYVRRYWRRLLVTAALGAVVGGLIFTSLPTRYYATSRVAMSPQLTYLSLSSDTERQPLVTLDTTAALLRSDRSVRRIGEAMGVTPEETRESLVISAKPGSRVLVVQVRADSRRQAAAGANTATEQLLALQADTFAINRARVRALKNRASTLRRLVLEDIAEGSPAQGLLQTVELLETRLDQAVLTNNSESAVIVRAQVVEYRPGQAEVFVASGLTVGILFGMLTTLLRRPGSGRSAVPAHRRRYDRGVVRRPRLPWITAPKAPSALLRRVHARGA